ncbi:myelin protein zero-like protein 3 [Amblyraja radiata]|uniref:myelin protein zero-like protein 3 n=1 Tax=Amblyraja radiata TaxID=386614 RepID=UPI001403E8E5|nr:myelin protein zero-like protein 3 [Amblyraja radiata]
MSPRERNLEPGRNPHRLPALWLFPLLLLPGFATIEVSLKPTVQGFIGEDIQLNCKFRSSSPITQRLTVDWSFRPAKGGSTHGILYYHSAVFPAAQGPLKDRVLWNGNVMNGNASIVVKNLTLVDNGTFSCVVQNPPDLSSFVPTTELTVIKRETPFRLSVVVVLMLLVVVPTLLVVTLLLVRTAKRFDICGSNGSKSPIEVLEGDGDASDDGLRSGCCRRCVACLQDTDEEDEDFHQFYPTSESVT